MKFVGQEPLGMTPSCLAAHPAGVELSQLRLNYQMQVYKKVSLVIMYFVAKALPSINFRFNYLAYLGLFRPEYMHCCNLPAPWLLLVGLRIVYGSAKSFCNPGEVLGLRVPGGGDGDLVDKAHRGVD